VIVVDSSAIVAVLLEEKGYEQFFEIMSSVEIGVPVTCYLEAVMVLRKHRISRASVDQFLASADVRMIACDERQAHLAAEAFERFGRGSGHCARLNFGDCLAYAAAKAHAAPLLFKGGDFPQRDVLAAI
jgi:ribonuclease VapC